MKRMTKKLASKNANATADADRVGNGMKTNSDSVLSKPRSKKSAGVKEFKTIKLNSGGLMKLFYVVLTTLSISAFAEESKFERADAVLRIEGANLTQSLEQDSRLTCNKLWLTEQTMY